MKMKTYTIGLDFGTLSCRGIIAHVADGEQIAYAQFVYPHGIMDTALPDGTKLSPGWALQHPQDYLDAMDFVIPELLRLSGVLPESVIGIGVDFTACTMLPVKADGTPLCFLPEYQKEPHAYVKLWKHHAAQSQADRITALAAERDEPFIKKCGGKASAQNLFPKLLQVIEEAPHVAQAMDLFMEAADWIVMQLTGILSRSACCLGYKAFFDAETGFPEDGFFNVLFPDFSGRLKAKLRGMVTPVAGKAGAVSPAAAKRLGLMPGAAVSAPMVDGHACFPASGILHPGKLLGILGTSAAYLMLSDSGEPIPGLCGMVKDGLVPGFYGLEAGLNCMGDHFDWVVKNICPLSYHKEALSKNIGLHELLTEKAQGLMPGQSGLIALDWWNGNRSLLMNTDLSGFMLGMTLRTAPEEIYRALLEATAFATRMITEHFCTYGQPVREFIATGGISRKNPLLMQILSDVLSMPVKVLATEQGSALGSAIYAAAASGERHGGYGSLKEAMQHMCSPVKEEFLPIRENTHIYDKLFLEYRLLHDVFGTKDGLMSRLLNIRRDAKRSTH